MIISGLIPGLTGGALIGLSAALLLWSHGRIAGISGILGHAADRDGRVYRWGFLGGLIATGAIAAAVVPSAFGGAVRGLPAVALAGVLVGAGTTLGGGCTSGHGVCGLSRGSPRSLVAVATFMITAAITVAIAGARS